MLSSALRSVRYRSQSWLHVNTRPLIIAEKASTRLELLSRTFASTRMAPSKKIIVCCDGTWQDSDDSDKAPTNVTKIARCLTTTGKSLKDGSIIPQIVYYQSGVATRSTGVLGQNFDGLTGRGINENIRAAYGFICNNYVTDDEIYLVGFSRGAYTARCISALINDIGLMTKHALGYFYDVYNAWQAKNVIQKHKPGAPLPASFRDIQQKLLSNPQVTRTNVRVNVCAVFDTVGSLGIPVADKGPFGMPVDYIKDALRAAGLSSLQGTEAFTFVDTVIAPCIDHGIQALALDEHRGHFVPTIWENPDNTAKSLDQVWFTGCHSHIGGGYNNNTSLANLTLAWMLNKLSPYLSYDDNIINTTKADSLLTEMHNLNIAGEEVPIGDLLTDSKTGLFMFDRNAVRTPSLYRTHRLDPKTNKPLDAPLKNTNEKIHRSVRVRWWNSTELLANKEKYQPLALKGKWDPNADEPWPWKWLKVDEGVPDMPEEELSTGEFEILKKWSNTPKQTLASFDLGNATR